jgi:hypothetical protein
VLTDPVNAILAQGKRVLRQVLVRSSLTFVVVWALGIILGIAISLYRSRSVPAAPTWMFVVGVTALPATVAGQLAGALTVLIALTQLAGTLVRVPQLLVNQLTANGKDMLALAPWAQKEGRGSTLPVSLLSALGVALVTTMLTPRYQPSNEKPPVK